MPGAGTTEAGTWTSTAAGTGTADGVGTSAGAAVGIADGTSSEGGSAAPPAELEAFSRCDLPLMAGERVVDVAAGGFHSLAFTSNGRVLGWGDSSHGQLGDARASAGVSIRRHLSRCG